MPRYVGLPPVPLDQQRPATGLPGLLVLIPELHFHRDLGEWHATVPRLIGAIILVALFNWITGGTSWFLTLLFWSSIIAALSHRWAMVKRHHVPSMSPGVSHLEPAWETLRQRLGHLPVADYLFDDDQTGVYLIGEPLLLGCLAALLWQLGDPTGGAFVSATAIALGWQAIKLKSAARRTVSAMRDAPLQQQELLSQAMAQSTPPAGAPAMTQLLTPLRTVAPLAEAPPADVMALQDRRLLHRLSGSVAAAITHPTTIAADTSDATDAAQVS